MTFQHEAWGCSRLEPSVKNGDWILRVQVSDDTYLSIHFFLTKMSHLAMPVSLGINKYMFLVSGIREESVTSLWLLEYKIININLHGKIGKKDQ